MNEIWKITIIINDITIISDSSVIVYLKKKHKKYKFLYKHCPVEDV